MGVGRDQADGLHEREVVLLGEGRPHPVDDEVDDADSLEHSDSYDRGVSVIKCLVSSAKLKTETLVQGPV